MYLIIAEKPSLARTIVNAIGNMKRKDNYYENDKYIVTNVFGHLFTLADVEDYQEKISDYKWKMDNLPCFPEKFKFNLKTKSNKEPDEGIIKQFETIKMLINRDDVTGIFNAGDSDREGEVIIRLIIQNTLETQKDIYRLWLPDQTEKTILKSLDDYENDSKYDNLANEGFARTYIDWLYGVNLTRYATLKSGTLLRVGRVIVPIVKAIYDRDLLIRNFVPDIYYGITSNEPTNGEKIELNSKEKFLKTENKKAMDLCQKYNEQEAVVIDKKVKKDILNPGKLYSLSKLQNVLGTKYKMSMEKVLQTVQKLYEMGYLTYPRTNSEYLSTNEKDRIKSVLKEIIKIGYPVIFKDKKTIFDDSKIESHSALTPTYKIPDKDKLNEEELLVYQTVFKRFVAVFCSVDCKIEKTEIRISVGKLEEFNLKGTTIIEKGWTKFDDSTTKDKILPNLNVGDKININFKPKEKETSAPKHYTIATLNNYLKNPFKEDKKELEEKNIDTEEDDYEEYKAIFEGLELGTEATRTGIIENAINTQYISLKKDVYTILPMGEYLIESLIQMGISMDKYKTSELGKALKKVYRNEITITDSLKIACAEIQKVFDKKELPIEKDKDVGFFGDVIGKCPICGSDVIKNRYNYGCKNFKKCSFKINTIICDRIISKNNASLLLENGITSKIEGFKSKNGKLFDARLKLDNNKIIFDFNN